MTTATSRPVLSRLDGILFAVPFLLWASTFVIIYAVSAIVLPGVDTTTQLPRPTTLPDALAYFVSPERTLSAVVLLGGTVAALATCCAIVWLARRLRPLPGGVLAWISYAIAVASAAYFILGAYVGIAAQFAEPPSYPFLVQELGLFFAQSAYSAVKLVIVYTALALGVLVSVGVMIRNGVLRRTSIAIAIVGAVAIVGGLLLGFVPPFVPTILLLILGIATIVRRH